MSSYGMHKRVSLFSLSPEGRARYTSWRVRLAMAVGQHATYQLSDTGG